jgi:radical SAM superfamily enzyme YgiQ (UPF0313 family)
MIIENANVVIITDFMDPYFWSRAIGAYRIATEVRKHGYTCQVIDCFTELTEEEKTKVLTKAVGDKTLMVGISSTFMSMIKQSIPNPIVKSNDVPTSTLAVPAHQLQLVHTENYPYAQDIMQTYFDKIKELSPKCKIVLGGAKASHHNAPGADVIMTGLADAAIIEYLRFLENKNPFFTMMKIQNKEQWVVHGDKYPFDFCNSSVIYDPCDNIMPGESLPIEISRGCIFSCKFCAFPLNGKKKNDYIKPINVIHEEFIRNYNDYGVTNYVYLDDTHNDNSDKLADLAKVVQSLPFKISFASYLRIDLLRAKPEQYQMLHDGGLVGCFFGIETLNYESAKCIGKGLHPDKVVEELHRFKFVLPQVTTMGGFICGLPYETKESVIKWADQIASPSFPLSTSYIEALLLNRNPNKLYRSEFEKETDTYYTWENDSMTNWDNGSFNREWALNFCLDRFRQNIKNKRTQLAGFHTIAARNVQVNSIPPDKTIAEVVVPLRTQMRRKYIDKLFNG